MNFVDILNMIWAQIYASIYASISEYMTAMHAVANEFHTIISGLCQREMHS